MGSISKVERLSMEKVWKLLLEMFSQTTFSLLVYAIYSITDTYFLSVGIRTLAIVFAQKPKVLTLGCLSDDQIPTAQLCLTLAMLVAFVPQRAAQQGVVPDRLQLGLLKLCCQQNCRMM
jgi:hypothetical protein